MPKPIRRARATKGPSEFQIHMAVVEHLKLRAPRDCFWWHTPNGEKRDKRTAAKLKAMGTKAGVSDIVAIHRGRTYGLELKTTIGRPSREQQHTLQAMADAGAFVAVAYGLDGALAILERWGLITPDRGRATFAA